VKFSSSSLSSSHRHRHLIVILHLTYNVVIGILAAAGVIGILILILTVTLVIFKLLATWSSNVVVSHCDFRFRRGAGIVTELWVVFQLGVRAEGQLQIRSSRLMCLGAVLTAGSLVVETCRPVL
jgi:hypothetical protein